MRISMKWEFIISNKKIDIYSLRLKRNTYFIYNYAFNERINFN